MKLRRDKPLTYYCTCDDCCKRDPRRLEYRKEQLESLTEDLVDAQDWLDY